ncbi:membrane protein [Gordonia phage JKSyngboy]|uniref:Membrane protein n=1 Tax=Gordonia phage JKSyngboy TaxID=2762400 RepID=A0A7G8LL57_9CAUD|nr:membrane protein [Gordonia phage JKSyngboy]QNJ57979.1 membrane protein [Gordonia phage JKSyngboy]
MSGYRPRPAGRWRGSVPPPGGAGVARPGSAHELRKVPRIAAVVRVGSEVARFDDRGHLIASSTRFWEALRTESPDTIDVWFADGASTAVVERVADVIEHSEDAATKRLAAVMSAQHEAEAAAHVAGAGVLFDPNLGRKDTVGDWPVADLVEFVNRSGTQVPNLPPNVELQQFVAKIVEQAKAEGREVCALVRDHGGRLTKVLGYANGNHRVDVEFVDWGSSEYPDERVRADRRAARADSPDPFSRMFRALAAFFEAVPRAIRNHPRRYFGIGVPVILIATGQVGAWLAAIDWLVVAVSTLIVLAGVFVVALSVSRRNYRREIADQQAALAERAQQQHEEWLKE